MDGADRMHGLGVYPYVRDHLEKGTAPSLIQAGLIEQGVDAAEATALVERALEHERRNQIRELAEPYLVNKKISGEEIERELAARGFDPQSSASVVKELVAARDRALREEGSDAGPLYRIAGVVVILLGFLLIAGNQSGFFATFPFAGTITIGIGIVFLVVGPRLGGSS